jgi:hypothetical protein
MIAHEVMSAFGWFIIWMALGIGAAYWAIIRRFL